MIYDCRLNNFIVKDILKYWRNKMYLNYLLSQLLNGIRPLRYRGDLKDWDN